MWKSLRLRWTLVGPYGQSLRLWAGLGGAMDKKHYRKLAKCKLDAELAVMDQLLFSPPP